MNRLRIGLVHPYLWPEVRRGGERYLDDLADYLATAGHDVHVVTGGDRRLDEVVGRCTLHRRRVRGTRLAARSGLTEVDLFGASAYGTLLTNRFDVVHALVPSAALAARLAAQRTVYTLLGHPSRDQLRERPRTGRLLGAAVRHANVIAALSRPSAAATRDLFGRDPVVLPPGVRLDRFLLEPRPRAGAPRVLYASDLGAERKGLDVLLAALARLLPDRPDLRLLLTGPGDPGWAFNRLPPDERSALAAATTVAQAASQVELTGHYQAATVTALPAREEAFGLVLVESLACGTPVVCCTGSGMSDIVVDGAIGQAVPYGDPALLATALAASCLLAANPATPALCRRAAERFGWTGAVGPAHVRLYAKLRDKGSHSRTTRPASRCASEPGEGSERTGPDR